jgi:8-oxo-dGTP pyrophosphatase MutT (NUDIX family)
MKLRKPGKYGDWKLVNSKVVYDNPWIRIEHDEVKIPSGKPGIYGRIHFKNLAIGIIPLDDDGNTWIVGQYRYPLKRYSWEIPEGGGDLRKSPIAEAKRELKEETGISAKRWEKLIEMDLSNSTSDERAVVFVARGLKFGESEPEDDEALKVRKIPFEKLYRMVQRGEVRDAITVAGVLALKLRLG